MSVVTNVMVSFCVLEWEDDCFGQRLTSWFADKGGLSSIAHGFADPPPYAWGGTKHPECQLWAGAYNHLDLPGMLGHFERLPWGWRELVQVFVMEQEEATFCVYMFEAGRLKRLLPYAAWPKR